MRFLLDADVIINLIKPAPLPSFGEWMSIQNDETSTSPASPSPRSAAPP